MTTSRSGPRQRCTTWCRQCRHSSAADEDRRSPGLTRFYRRVVHRRLQPDAPFRFREMAISGARLQLGIAPAGTGKTTALRALATAWRQAAAPSSGSPSASAAAVLRDAGQPSLAVTLHGDKIRKRGRSTAAARETRASLSAQERSSSSTSLALQRPTGPGGMQARSNQTSGSGLVLRREAVSNREDARLLGGMLRLTRAPAPLETSSFSPSSTSRSLRATVARVVRLPVSGSVK